MAGINRCGAGDCDTAPLHVIIPSTVLSTPRQPTFLSLSPLGITNLSSLFAAGSIHQLCHGIYIAYGTRQFAESTLLGNLWIDVSMGVQRQPCIHSARSILASRLASVTSSIWSFFSFNGTCYLHEGNNPS